MRGPNNVGRAVQNLDPKLLRYVLAITEQKNGWKLLAQKFDQVQTSCNNSQQHATGCANRRNMYVTPNNVWSCWPQGLTPSLERN